MAHLRAPARRAGLTLAISVVSTVVGCAQVLGVGDFTDASGTSAAGAGGTVDTGGASSAGGGQGGSGASSGTEDCLDRVDNNGDSLADCEDPQCQSTHQCAPLAPEGWIGVGWIHETDAAVECAEPFRTGLFEPTDLDVPAGSCACACGDPDAFCRAGIVCASGCQTGTTALNNPAVENPCTPDTVTSGALQCWAGTLNASAHSCDPVGALSAPSTSWPAAGVACLHGSAGHCSGTNQGCVPRAPEGGRGPCVAQAGDVDCPTDFPNEVTGFWDGTTDDGRSCSPALCSCGAPQGATCTCTGSSSQCGVRVYTGYDTCSGTNTSLAPFGGGSCATKSSTSPAGSDTPVSFALVNAAVSDPGSCTAQGTSALSGAVQAGQPMTVCCTE